MPIPRAPRWSLTRDCAFGATGLEGAIGVRGGGGLYSRIGVLAWYGPGLFGMARGTPLGMVMDCRVLVCWLERFLAAQACERASWRSFDHSCAPPTSSSVSLQPKVLVQEIETVLLHVHRAAVYCILMATDTPTVVTDPAYCSHFCIQGCLSTSWIWSTDSRHR
jgi:hypothetical protein